MFEGISDLMNYGEWKMGSLAGPWRGRAVLEMALPGRPVGSSPPQGNGLSSVEYNAGGGGRHGRCRPDKHVAVTGVDKGQVMECRKNPHGGRRGSSWGFAVAGLDPRDTQA
jgi:hypothetical protein